MPKGIRGLANSVVIVLLYTQALSMVHSAKTLLPCNWYVQQQAMLHCKAAFSDYRPRMQGRLVVTSEGCHTSWHHRVYAQEIA